MRKVDVHVDLTYDQQIMKRSCSAVPVLRSGTQRSVKLINVTSTGCYENGPIVSTV